MVVSLARMFKSLTEPTSRDVDAALNAATLPPLTYPGSVAAQQQQAANPERATGHVRGEPIERDDQRLRAERVSAAVAEVNNHLSPTPLTDRYLENRKHYRSPNRPPFDPATLWTLKHGRCPIMTELIHVVDERTLNAMPIEAVAILDRINQKLGRYREWSSELSGEQEEWICERQFVIDKLINESIPEALNHYEQLLRFSPHRTRNNTVHGNMTAGDMLTDLFLEIDYELDELLDELHNTVLNRLASTHRYVKSRTKS